MGCCAWESLENRQKIHFHTSTSYRSLLEYPPDSYDSERREHSAFQKLLRTVPGLEERLMEGSDENIIHIADLVYYPLLLTLAS
jgi:hypothetical protein